MNASLMVWGAISYKVNICISGAGGMMDSENYCSVM